MAVFTVTNSTARTRVLLSNRKPVSKRYADTAEVA